MGDEFQLGNGSWWDTSRNRSFDTETPPSVSISTTLNTIASFGSSGDAAAAAGSSADQNFQMMGLGLPSQNLDWNHGLLGEKVEAGFRSLLQDDFQPKLYSGDDSMKQANRSGFTLDQTAPFASQASSNDGGGGGSGFQVDFHGMLLSQNQPTMNYQYGYGEGGADNKYLQFSRSSSTGSPLHFTNNAPFWNAPAPEMNDRPRSSFFPTHQISSSFDDKSKSSDFRDLNTKKSSSEPSSNKRPRVNETPSPMPAFKARKEKMGDRITALQQLVSPFGKTDTASVLSEAISYIKFLHEQVSVLSNPYMKNGAPVQHQHMNTDKSKDSEGPRQDLRSRGLCLVPVSSTYPIAHETTVDFWTPTFGGTFR